MSSTPTQLPESTLNSLKRQIALLEEENQSLKNKKNRSATEQETSLARGVRKIVSFHVPLKSLVNENDRRETADDDNEVGEGPPTLEDRAEQRERDRNYGSFKVLQRLFTPSFLQRVLEDPGFLDRLREWEKAGDDARGSDIKRLRDELANWINIADHDDLLRPEDPSPGLLDPKSRSTRGYNNFLTGLLLCPISYDWRDPEIRCKIQNMDDEYPTHEQYLVRMLFAGYATSPFNWKKGFLRATLLVRTYKHIFTSCNSATHHVGEAASEDSRPKKKRQRTTKEPTKRNVASILGMTAVTARSIAYAAVMLHFNLTTAESWNMVVDGFNYTVFYDVIVDYFEGGKLASEEEIKDLLNWWNQQVFGERVAVTSPTAGITHEDNLARQELWKECGQAAAAKARASLPAETL
ncbi:hypothetical protein V5O48_012226 [Marasmius crinis-equi]|uniref:Uncharacterized protein n=1 Tax=Marasmius crinis-equi TaxID=585013 RepID=A0ABR3F3D0_9AGAR